MELGKGGGFGSLLLNSSPKSTSESKEDVDNLFLVIMVMETLATRMIKIIHAEVKVFLVCRDDVRVVRRLQNELGNAPTLWV